MIGVLPSFPDLERRILGFVLSFGELDNLRSVVEVEDFSTADFRLLWQRICDVYDAGSPVDRVTVVHALMAHQELRHDGSLLSMGGLSELENGVIRDSHLPAYVEKLQEATLRRRMMMEAHRIGLLASDDGTPAADTMEAFSTAATELSRASCDSKRPISTAKLIETEGVDKLLAPRRHTGPSLPWPQLDDALCGLSPGQLIVLMADTSRGKTSMALQIATSAAIQEYNPLIWTMEMSVRSLFRRMVTQISGFAVSRRQTTFEEREGQRTAIAQLLDHPIHLDHSSRSVSQFCANLRACRAKLGVVDYLQLIRGTGGHGTRAQEVSDNSRALKCAAMDLGIPILALSQVDRSSVKGGGKIGVHSAKESGDIENDSDIELAIQAGELSREQPTAVALEILKQREGAAGFSIPMIFNPLTQTFHEVCNDH